MSLKVPRVFGGLAGKYFQKEAVFLEETVALQFWGDGMVGLQCRKSIVPRSQGWFKTPTCAEVETGTLWVPIASQLIDLGALCKLP